MKVEWVITPIPVVAGKAPASLTLTVAGRYSERDAASAIARLVEELGDNCQHVLLAAGKLQPAIVAALRLALQQKGMTLMVQADSARTRSRRHTDYVFA